MHFKGLPFAAILLPELEEAILLYTWEPAHAEFMEDRKGMRRAGYLADMVVFDRDLMNIPAEEILSAQVDYTIVGGKIVFQRPTSN